MREASLSWLSLAFIPARSFAAQPDAPAPIEAPLRELPWGQLNFLHTTDTHGWHGGHLQEPSFSGDWGDYISFAHHLRKRADADGSDLLLVDTGDRIEGNGLYDASDPKGKYTFDIFKQQKIDLICSGNHELYKVNASNDEFHFTVPNFKGSYLASNLDIYNPDTGKREPLAPRYKKFTTKNQGIRIMAFGFIFDFQGNANNTVVTTVEETTKQAWFKEAIRDREVDLILVFGHVAIRSKEYDLLFKTIRSVQWDTPIAILGGHTHIRDYVKYDSRSYAIESGRYMETIGFMSISGLSTPKGKDDSENRSAADEEASIAKGPTFARRYIDNNLFSLHHHSGTNESTFATELGKNTSAMITKARHKLQLDTVRACAPRTFYLSRVPYPDHASILSLLEQNILSEYLNKTPRADGKKIQPAVVLTNTGAIRFDIFKGAYTRDTEYLVCPFTSGFRFVPDVPYDVMSKLLALLNSEGPILDDIAAQTGLQKWMLVPPEQYAGRKDNPVTTHTAHSASRNWLSRLRSAGQTLLSGGKSPDDSPELTPGYTTSDDAGDDGDDTLHSEIAFYNVPNVIQAPVGFDPSTVSAAAGLPETVDVAYNEFIEPWIVLALQYLGHKPGETATFVHATMADAITSWVVENWKVPESGRCE